MATLVDLGQFAFDKRSHLEDAQHLLALVLKCKEIREELDLEGMREFIFHFVVVKVEEL